MPPGGNPIVVQYIISYHIISYIKKNFQNMVIVHILNPEILQQMNQHEIHMGTIFYELDSNIS